MDNGEIKFKRGNGKATLKKRLGVLVYLLALLPLVIYFLFYIYKNNEIKSLTRSIDQLEKERGVLIDRYRNLVSEYDKISTSQELKDYAVAVLNMEPVSKEIQEFTVLDRNMVFMPTDYEEMPDLFENRLNLAVNNKNNSTKRDEE